MRLKATVRFCQNGLWGDEPDGVHDIVCVRVADFDRVKRRVALDDPTYRSVPASRRGGRVLRADDLLIEKSGGGEKQPVGCVVHFDHPVEAICSNFVARMPVEPGHDARFLSYVHASLYSLGLTERSIKQTTGIQNLDAEAYLDERVEIPPLAEQRSIAVVLDRKTAAIDALIAKKERLIELLQEKRQALITRAVTTGLDPNVSMKDSGVEWLGEVPVHWRLLRLKNTVRSCQGGVWGDEADGVNDVVCVRVADFKRSTRRVSLDDPTLRSLPEQQRKGRLLKNGDLLIEKSGGGQKQPVGTVVIFDHEVEAVCSNFIARVPCCTDCDPHFMVYLHHSLYALGLNARSIKQTTGIQNLDVDSYLSEWVAIPPLAEQRTIALNLNLASEAFEMLGSRILQSVALLRAYRQALISAAVTGKIEIPVEEAA